MKYESGCAGVSYGFLVVSTRQPWAGTARVGEHQKVWGNRVERMPTGITPIVAMRSVTATAPYFLMFSLAAHDRARARAIWNGVGDAPASVRATHEAQALMPPFSITPKEKTHCSLANRRGAFFERSNGR